MRKTRVFQWLTVAFGFGLGAASGCGGREPVGTVTGPIADGQSCGQASEVAKASDGCNICSCTNGTWGCTKETCGGSSAGSSTCTDGDTKVADDGCNTCSCSAGAWGCSTKACPSTCTLGETQTIDCNTCACTASGGWVCTEKACNSSGSSSGNVGDPFCKDGETKPADDGCNTCSCTGGAWFCTLKSCQDACKTGQQAYSDFRTQLLAKYDSIGCQTAKDCTLVYESNGCVSNCGTAIPASVADSVDQNLTTAGGSDCSACPPPDVPPCVPLFADCVNGACSTSVGLAPP